MSNTSLNLIAFGPYWWVFWIFHLVLGSLSPFTCCIAPRKVPKAVAWACFLIVITFVAVRFNFVIPDLAVYKLEGLEATFFHARLRTDQYFPNLNEWLVSLWVVFPGVAGLSAGVPLAAGNRCRVKEKQNMSKTRLKRQAGRSADFVNAKMDRRRLSEMLGPAGWFPGRVRVTLCALRWQRQSRPGLRLDVGDAYTQHLPENQIYSVCQQCNTNCGIKVKIVDGVVAKIDGNPYSPWTLTPHIPYETPLADAATIEGSLCPKGQAGIQALYDPYRIVKVLETGRQARRKQMEDHSL